ncbi:SH3 and cysteine-rich domain-containing protein [Platysternon megacephalum]|uniref:SH3 and cysteine-rich domain-containing protein n=1 Tax=Platysternon megacephalum TaxID=55544 RepID=A0A4D9END7_9SAUR|nr:SH3 and cysteine-rich domain-containing protein [Platysternon megacephalum]
MEGVNLDKGRDKGQGGGAESHADLPKETLSWKMCGGHPVTGEKVLLKMVRAAHKELQLSPWAAAFPGASPHESGRSRQHSGNHKRQQYRQETWHLRNVGAPGRLFLNKILPALFNGILNGKWKGSLTFSSI